MPDKKITKLDYFKKTLKWLIFNTLIGLAPLLFMWAINGIADHEFCQEEIKHLIKDGVVLFVCCAIMGSVVIDFYLGGHELYGIQHFSIKIFPFCILAYILFDYLLIYQKINSSDNFNLSSLTSIIIISLSAAYCLIAKTLLYIKEDTKHKKL